MILDNELGVVQERRPLVTSLSTVTGRVTAQRNHMAAIPKDGTDIDRLHRIQLVVWK
jgi:hypothetical protein